MIFSILLCCLCLAQAEKCIGPNGQAVDWWMMLKANSQSGHPNAFVKNGTAYTYIDSKVSSLFYASADITSPSSPLGKTLAQVYKNKPEVTFMYNDETPDGKTSSSYAHSKGVIGASGNEGFWLIHSVPAYPPPSDKPYAWSDKGTQYGQSFLCLSLDRSNMNKVGMLQQHNHPQIYEAKVSAGAAAAMPDLAAAIKGQSVLRNPATHITDIRTIGGTTFRGYAKNAPWGQDLAPNLIIPDIKADMVWETWMRPYEAPFCPARPAKQCYSAETLSAKMADGNTYTWKETQDHSKWGVSMDKAIPVTCIGDINRMNSQKKRGGGAVCLRNSQVHSMFLALIQSRDSCSSTNSEFVEFEN